RDGTLQAPLNFSSEAFSPQGIAVGYFNHDGFPDLAIPDFSSNTVVVLINSGSWDPPASTTAASGRPICDGCLRDLPVPVHAVSTHAQGLRLRGVLRRLARSAPDGVAFRLG